MAEQQQTDKHGRHDSSNNPAQHEGHEMHKDHNRSKHADHKAGKGHEGGDHHAHMVADFRRRFWISLGATVPILALSPMIQAFLGFKQAFRFSGDAYVSYIQHLKYQVFVNFSVLYSRPQQFGPITIQPQA